MPALNNLTTQAQITVTTREVDFVTRFSKNWDALRTIMGIMKPIRKTPGTRLISYEAKMDGDLQGGTTVAEGDVIPFTKFKVEEVSYRDVDVAKYAKSVSIEAVQKYGADVAIEKTDDQFLVELQNKTLNDFYAFLKTGTLNGSKKTWQEALAIAKGAVVNRFAAMNRTVTEVVGFANIMDLYSYVGAAEITTQTAFGLQYIQNFLGYKTLFLLPAEYIPEKTVIALPVENIDLYYVDPSDSDFAKMGLQYTVDGETNLIGFHVEGDYTRATGNSFAIMGMKLWAEYLDGIAVVTVGETDKNPEVAAQASDTEQSSGAEVKG